MKFPGYLFVSLLRLVLSRFLAKPYPLTCPIPLAVDLVAVWFHLPRIPRSIMSTLSQRFAASEEEGLFSPQVQFTRPLVGVHAASEIVYMLNICVGSLYRTLNQGFTFIITGGCALCGACTYASCSAVIILTLIKSL